MKNVKKTVILSCVLLGVMSSLAHGKTVFVSPSGDDIQNNGSIDSPWKTIQRGVQDLEPGDTCFLRKGMYFETVTQLNSGTPEKPIRIHAYKGEKVILMGTEKISGDWQVHDGKIMKLKIDKPYYQLFSGTSLMIPARWPNQDKPGDIDDYFANNKRAVIDRGKSSNGTIYPENFPSDLDWDGAYALTAKHHQNWMNKLFKVSHTPGNRFVTYPPIDYSDSHEQHFQTGGYITLKGKLAALDSEYEWVIQESEPDTLYFRPPDNVDKSTFMKRLHGKVRFYAFDLKATNHIEIKGITFFGLTTHFTDCDYITVDSCRYIYPTLKTFTSSLGEETAFIGDCNVFKNSYMAYALGSGLSMNGFENRAENNLIHHIVMDWGSFGIIFPRTIDPKTSFVTLDKGHSVARYNTIHTSGYGGIAVLCPYGIAEYNDLSNGALLKEDDSMLYTALPWCNGIQFRYNWVHNHKDRGIRGDDISRGLSIHHNVVYNVRRPMIVKGDANIVANNTVIHGEYTNVDGKQFADIGYRTGNEERKAGYEKFFKYLEGEDPPFSDPENKTSILENNLIVSEAERDEILSDVAKFDFTLNAGVSAIDAGKEVPSYAQHFDGDDSPDYTVGYVGAAPDLGAYEFGQEKWVPGHTWGDGPALDTLFDGLDTNF